MTVHTETRGYLGLITLDRPQALNALNTDMCAAMTQILLDWRDDDTVKTVLVSGAGDRAFCAGGDVVMLHDSGKAGDGRAEDFWRTEYALNDLIKSYPKPYIALIDGIVMGGGVGLSVHGRYRVAGDTTLFAMPETGIGYFPDVGGTYFLPRLGRAVGTWLGLTGARLGPAECLDVGIATHVVPTHRHEALIEALTTSTNVPATLDDFAQTPTVRPIPEAVSAFDHNTVGDILSALDVAGSDWAARQASILCKKSPLALAVTLRALRGGADLDWRDAMRRELDLSLGFLRTQDFYEGIRAQLIDKDRNPKWSHDIGEVTSDHIGRLFRPTEPPLEFPS